MIGLGFGTDITETKRSSLSNPLEVCVKTMKLFRGMISGISGSKREQSNFRG
jgi:hypothetical protein